MSETTEAPEPTPAAEPTPPVPDTPAPDADDTEEQKPQREAEEARAKEDRRIAQLRARLGAAEREQARQAAELAFYREQAARGPQAEETPEQRYASASAPRSAPRSRPQIRTGDDSITKGGAAFMPTGNSAVAT